MLKKVLLAALALVCVPNLVLAANEKIDPETYLCAELVSNETLLQGEAPLFEGLQLDGYASAAVNMDVASPDAVHIILNEAVNWCQERPTDKVYSIWQQMRATGPVPEGDWNAKTSTCADFALNQDDASGFIIWLDGYNRKANNTTKSILKPSEPQEDHARSLAGKRQGRACRKVADSGAQEFFTKGTGNCPLFSA